MPATATRLWAIPLTAVLSVNILLIGLAFRHVGSEAQAEPLVSEAPPPAAPIDTKPLPTTAHIQPAANSKLQFALNSEAAAATSDRDSIPEGELESCPIVEAWSDEEVTAPAAVVIRELPNSPVRPQVEEPISGSLIFINPPATRGAVHFEVDGKVLSLAAGEYQRLPAGVLRRVRFHRGGDYGDVDQRCSSGVFAFTVNEQGWSLAEVDRQAADRLVKLCAPAKGVHGEW